MVTRLYFHQALNGLSNLPTTEQSSLTSNKDVDAQNVNRSMDTTIGTAQQSLVLTSNTTTSIQRYYFTAFVSLPLSGISSITAQTWTYNFSTVTNAAGANFPVTGTNKAVRVTCYVWRPSTQTKVGDILDGNSALTVDITTSQRIHSTTFSGALVSSVQDGDVIIFEVWFEITQGIASALTDTFFYDGTTVNTTKNAIVTNHASFIETPQNLTFTAALTRVSLSRIYRYALNSRISLGQIYRYSLNGRISLSRIYKYGINSRISLTRIYKYQLLNKISLSRIYRYKLQNRLSLSRTYRYLINQRISLQRIYKYSIIQRLSLSRIYSYKLSSRLSLSRIYRYGLNKRLSLSRIYQYKIIGRISRPSIYKYNLLNTISKSRIYKYRLLNKISLSRIYKYKLSARISSSRIFRYKLLTKISLSQIYRYGIKSRVSLSNVYIYNIISTLLRASKSSIYRYAIKQRLTIPRIYKYNILTKVGISRIYNYKIVQKVGAYHLAFDGINDYVDCGNDASLWSQSLTKFSFSVWVYINSVGGSNYAPLVNHGAHVTQSFYCYVNTGSGLPTARVFGASSYVEARVTPITSLIERWVHIVFVYDNSLGSANLKIYCDGILGSVTGNLTEAINLSTTLRLGDLGWFAGHLDGMIKDFRWWSTIALNQPKVTALYNAGANNTNPIVNTPDYWLTTEERDSNDNAIDRISGTKIATLQNGTFWMGMYPLTGRTQAYQYNILEKLTTSKTYLYKIFQRVPSLSRIYRYNILQRVGRAIAIHFDGVDDSITIGSPTILNNLDNFTISMWVYPSSLGTSTPHLFVKNYSSANSFILYFSGTGSYQVNWRTVNNALVNVTSTSTYINTGGANKWYHILLTFNRTTGLQQLYIDNVLRDSDTNTGMTPDSIGGTAAMTINGGGGAAKWGGHIKDFRLWRSELTQSDIDKVYANDSSAPVPNYWLKMEETQGDLLDSISGTLTATLVNGPTRVFLAPPPWLAKTQTYLYNLLNKISLSRIYRYAIINFVRVSLARKYRYNILQDVLKVSTYRYRILQKLTKLQTYHYAIIARMSSSKTYKYRLLQQLSTFHNYVYKIQSRLSLERKYRYRILTEQPSGWALTGKLTDFPDSIENLLKNYVNANWFINTPSIGSDLESNPIVDNFSYDHFRTYYMKIKEGASFVDNHQVRSNTYTFSTPVEFECYSRRLKKGEAFQELNEMIWELVRIFGSYQKEQVYGIQGVTLDTISSIDEIGSPGQVLWQRKLKISVHYYKVTSIGAGG